jgi:hypothetical protein
MTNRKLRRACRILQEIQAEFTHRQIDAVAKTLIASPDFTELKEKLESLRFSQLRSVLPSDTPDLKNIKWRLGNINVR